MTNIPMPKRVYYAYGGRRTFALRRSGEMPIEAVTRAISNKSGVARVLSRLERVSDDGYIRVDRITVLGPSTKPNYGSWPVLTEFNITTRAS